MNRLMRYSKLLFACVLALLSAGPILQVARAESSGWKDADYARFTPQTFSAYAPAQRAIDPRAIDYELLSAALFYATNAERIKHGHPPFAHSRALRNCAFEHSRDMAAGNFFSHENPRNSAMRTPWQRMAAHGITGGYRAENIAMWPLHSSSYQSCAAAIVNQWMKSRGHRANILSRKCTLLGCGAHVNKKRQLLCTQNFR
jgi:uncharacterized protein YkwD